MVNDTSSAMRATWWSLLVLLLADRALLLFHFGAAYTGTDDVVQWLAASDRLQGVFREPYFYGQNYNFMLEALLAAPLLVALPHHVALPLATSALALLPWVVFSVAFRRQGNHLGSLVFLLMPILLPVEHGMLTAMSRGFITGLAPMALLAAVMFHPLRASSHLLLGIATGLGVTLNPNCIPFLIPVGLHLWLSHRPPWRHALLVAVPVALMLSLEHWAKRFYVDHPDHLTHWMEPLSYWPADVVDAFSRLDMHFAHLTPLFWSWGWGAPVLLALLAWWSARLDRKWSRVLWITLAATVLMLGINKVSDGTASLFHLPARMFLALPLVLALGLAWSLRGGVMDAGRWRLVMIATGITVFTAKAGVLDVLVEKHVRQEDQGPVAVHHVEALRWECGELARLAETFDAELVLLVPDWKRTPAMMSIRAYGCPEMEPGLPPTLLQVGDRRTWRWHEAQHLVPGSVIIHGHGLEVHWARRLLGRDLLLPGEDLVVVRNNTRTVPELLALFGLRLKRHPYGKV